MASSILGMSEKVKLKVNAKKGLATLVSSTERVTSPLGGKTILRGNRHRKRVGNTAGITYQGSIRRPDSAGRRHSSILHFVPAGQRNIPSGKRGRARWAGGANGEGGT